MTDDERAMVRDAHDHLFRLWQDREAERPPRKPRPGEKTWSNPHEPYVVKLRGVLGLDALDTSGRTWE